MPLVFWLTVEGLAQAINYNAGKSEFSSSFERSGLDGSRVKNKFGAYMTWDGLSRKKNVNRYTISKMCQGLCSQTL